MNKQAVITGDIINSGKLETSVWLNKLREILSEIGQEGRDWEIFRGDSFQFLVSARQALIVALLIKSAMKSINIDVRMAIGLGEIDFRSDKITESNGPAFVNSGRKFETLKKETLGIQSGNKNFDKVFSVLLSMLDFITSSWRPTSSEVVYFALKNPEFNQSELARILNKKSQGTISSALKRAGFDEILKLLELYEYKLKEL